MGDRIRALVASHQWVRPAVAFAALAALGSALGGEIMPVPEGTTTSASGFSQGGVTLYEGTATAFDVTTDVLPGCVCHSATLTLATGAPQIGFSDYEWNKLPPIEAGDHVRVWTACSNVCDATTSRVALKVVSSRTTSFSDSAEFHNVDFSPESGSWQALAKVAGPAVGVLLGVAVCLLLWLVEATRLVPVSVAGALLGSAALPQLATLGQVNGSLQLVVPALGLGAVASALAARSAAKRKGAAWSPFAVVAMLVGGALALLVPAFLVLETVARGLMWA